MPRNSLYKDLIISEKPEAIHFPLRPKSNGKLETLSLSKDIVVQSIKNFLVTAFGERVMESRLGSGIPNLIGRKLTEDKKEFVNDIISEKISKNFPQVEVLNINVNDIGEDLINGFKVSADLKYKQVLKDDYENELFDKNAYDNNFFSIDITIIP